MDIIIDPEFQTLFPPQTVDEHDALEARILDEGCLEPLTVWGNILVDGHNRYAICQKHGIAFKTRKKDFPSREAAMAWMYETQLGRRNLSPDMMAYYRGKHYEMEKVTEPRNQHIKVAGSQNDHQQKTADRLGARYGVSPETIRRDAKISRTIDTVGEISPSAKSKLLSGAVKVNKKELIKMAVKPESEVEAFARQVESGTYKKSKPKAERKVCSQCGKQRNAKSFLSGGDVCHSCRKATDTEEKREIMKHIDAAYAALKGEVEAPEYRIEDLIEEIDSISGNLIQQLRRVLRIRDFVLGTTEAKAMAISALSKTNDGIKNIMEGLQ